MTQDATESLFSRIKQLFILARQEWLMLSTGVVMLFIGIAMTLVYPQLFRVIIDEALLNKRAMVLNQSTLLLVGSFVLYAVSGGVRYWLFTYSGEKIVASLRSRLFNHLLRQDMAFFDKQQTGSLLSRLATDTEAVQHTLSHELGLLIRYFCTALGGVVLLLFTSVELTLLLLVIVPPTAWLTGVSGNYIRKFSSQTQDALADASGQAEEALSAVRVVRSYAREQYESEHYSRAIARGLAFVKSRVALVSGLEGTVNLAASLAVVGVLWYGSTLVIASELTVGALTSFLIYTFLVTSSLTGLANIWTDFTRAAGAADRVFKILEVAPAASSIHSPSIQTIKRGELRFEHVTFCYPSRPNVPVLSDQSLHVAAGECVALVGPSGIGKSTISALLLRFYDANEGLVRIDGNDVSDYDPTALREQIALVEQDPVLFSASIYDNIRYGKLDATEQDIERAVTLANASEFIARLPDGIHTFVGAKGVQLSGGQKQRIAIARAMLKQPKVLILDEITSALDAENEKLVIEAIKNFKRDRTTLIIAHRLSTIALADRVIELQTTGTKAVKTNDYLASISQKQPSPILKDAFGTG